MRLRGLPYHLTSTPDHYQYYRVPAYPAPPVRTHIPSMTDIEMNKASPPPLPKRPLRSRLRLPDQPTFRTFIRLCWIDILTQLLCTGGAFLIYKFAPIFTPKHFPVFPGMETSVVGLRFGKPYLKEYVSTLVSAIVSFVGPLVVLLGVNLGLMRSFWDGNSAV